MAENVFLVAWGFFVTNLLCQHFIVFKCTEQFLKNDRIQFKLFIQRFFHKIKGPGERIVKYRLRDIHPLESKLKINLRLTRAFQQVEIKLTQLRSQLRSLLIYKESFKFINSVTLRY